MVILFYCVSVPLTLPISHFALGFGWVMANCYNSILWGIVVGYISVMAGIFCAAYICYILSRTILRKFINDHILKLYPKMARLDYAIQAEGLKLVFILRNLPIPYAYVSYILGVTNITAWRYQIGSLGVFFSMFNYVLIGAQLKTFTDEAAEEGQSMVLLYCMIGFEVVCLFVFMCYAVKIAQKALDDSYEKYGQ